MQKLYLQLWCIIASLLMFYSIELEAKHKSLTKQAKVEQEECGQGVLCMDQQSIIHEQRVKKYVLPNGLTLLVCPKKFAPKVAMQMWYHVGSKDEQPSEKGMAHFIEHMVFKGTQEMLSESDITALSQKLSAYTNAFTNYDVTNYVFDVPVANWEALLPIYADCMSNVKFDQEHMNSEVKAVIQELKMCRDHDTWVMHDALMPLMFEEHPYHYPIIGYKQDLWSLERKTLLNFYKKYYVPNNATFVIVGDVEPDDVYQKVKKAFAHVPRGNDIVRPHHYINDHLQSKTVTVYRDIEQPIVQFVFLVPGFKEKKMFFYDIVGYLLANGKSSILYKLLVDELQIAIDVHATLHGLFDRDSFWISVAPKNESLIPRIKELVLEQIYKLAHEPISDQQWQRVINFAHVERQHMLESVHDLALKIGEASVAFGDEQYPFNYNKYNLSDIKTEVAELLQRYFRSSLCHQVNMLKVDDKDRNYLNELQTKSDQLDTQILFNKERRSPVEDVVYAAKIDVAPYKKTTFPKPIVKILPNGLKILLHHNPDVDLISFGLMYKADHIYDPADKLGLSSVVSKLLLEGSTKYPGATFADVAETHGISFITAPGLIAGDMPANQAELGFQMLSEMLNNAQLDQNNLKKVLEASKLELIRFWDTPTKSIKQLASEKIYKNHPYGNCSAGTVQTLENITQQDCVEFYNYKISADKAALAVVGNLDTCNIDMILEEALSSWRNPSVSNVAFPELNQIKPEVFNVEKNRDQVALAFAGLSVRRLDSDFDALLVFNQILAGGMSSRLFELREATGLFYSIQGSLALGAAEEPGMIFVKTLVSKDRLEEAQQVIVDCLNQAIDTVTEDEFEQAKEVIVNMFPMKFETNEKTAETFLFLARYNLDPYYFENRIDMIRSLNLETMKNVVKSYLNSDKLITVKIGRLENN